MSLTSHLEVPNQSEATSRPSSSNGIPSKMSKSMLKNLFSWKKTPTTHDDENRVQSSPNVEIDAQSFDMKRPRPSVISQASSLSTQFRAEPPVPPRPKSRSKPRHRSRSRCRAAWDPPPLFQAYSQASMHDTLQIPNKGFLDWLPRNASNRSSTKNLDSVEDRTDSPVSPAMSHKRSTSDSSTSSLIKKLFFVFENGHILQYRVDGSHDRLPERVLELSRDSVAFASDAVLGQHWVLEICPNGRTADEVQSTTSKSPWSRMSLKAPDAKRTADKLLLVFDSPESLFTWLIAIRKQIEGFGGMEYQPDAPPLPQPDSKRPNLRHASSEYFKRKNGALFSRSSSALPLKLDDHTAHEKDLPQLPLKLTYQRSISPRSDATSSVVTRSSLDHCRESYSGSSTAGTAVSSDVSSKSLSPTKEAFSTTLKFSFARNLKSRTKTDKTDKTTARAPTSPLHNSAERSPSPTIVNVAADEDVRLESREHYCKIDRHAEAGRDGLAISLPAYTYDIDSASPVMVSQNHASAPATVMELRQRLRSARENFNTDEGSEQVERSDDVNLLHHHAKKPSLGSSSTGNYALFPKKMAVDVMTEPLMMPDRDHIPSFLQTQATSHVGVSASPNMPVAITPGKSLLARYQTNARRPAPIALPHLLAPVEIDSPMRTPAVTDAMLDTNFGTMFGGSATEPTTPVEIRVPSLSGIKIDITLFESVKQKESKPASPSSSPKTRNITPRRSLPNFHYGTTAAIPAPLAPPPSGPLPAVPQTQTNERRHSRTSPPGKRTSTQSAAMRRASMKSSSSAKKGRSPVPSFAFPKAQANAFSSPGIVSVSSFGSVEASPALTSMPSPKKKDSAATIGQVSVVPRPPPMPTTSHHKKSLSASSGKSHRSRKGHLRSPSTKSMHNSTNNIPAFSHLIASPCGFNSDSDFDSKDCFGIRTTRTGAI